MPELRVQLALEAQPLRRLLRRARPRALRQAARHLTITSARSAVGLVVAGGIALAGLAALDLRPSPRAAAGWRVAYAAAGRVRAPTSLVADSILSFVSADLEEGSSNRPVDLLILFDLTSSMNDDLAAVRLRADDIIRELQRLSGDLRLGLVGFLDVVLPEPFHVSPLTAAVDSQLTVLDGWTTGPGGHDPPEDHLHALALALQMKEWRTDTRGPRVAKVIVIITDAPPKDPDADGRTVDTVLRLNASSVQARIFTIVAGPDQDALRQAQQLAVGSGGSVFNVASSEQLVDTLLVGMESAIESATPWMWQAPRMLVRQITTSRRARLHFELFQGCNGSLFSASDIVLVGRAGTLTTSLPTIPTAEWTAYSFPLDSNTSWTDPETLTLVPGGDVARVTRSLQSLFIRGEYCVGPDSGGLRSARVTSQPVFIQASPGRG